MALELSGDSFSEYYYRHDCGTPYSRTDEWLAFFDNIANQIILEINPKSVLDAGCAWGFLVEALRSKGVEAYGMDISDFAISQVDNSVKEFCKVGSVAESFDRNYDLIVNIEVLEHMPKLEALKAIKNFCEHSSKILFSSTPIDYQEVTHINVQAPEYWAKEFAKYDFYRDMDFDASFITAWSSLLKRQDITKSELVTRYERKFWSLHKENVDLRSKAISDQNFLAQIENEAEVAKLDLQHYKNLLAIEQNEKQIKIEEQEKYISSLKEENEKIKDTLNMEKNKLTEAINKIEELNNHWFALQESRTWKSLKKFGRSPNFPDLKLSQEYLDRLKPIQNSVESPNQVNKKRITILFDEKQDVNPVKTLRMGQYDFTPVAGIKNLLENGVMEVVNNDPQLLIEPINKKMPSGGSYELYTQINSDQSNIEIGFYFDCGEGFTQEKSIEFSTLCNRINKTRIVLPDRIRRIRFDPGKSPGRIRLVDFRLIKITPFHTTKVAIEKIKPKIDNIDDVLLYGGKGLKMIISGGIKSLEEKVFPENLQSYSQWVDLYDELSDEQIRQIGDEISKFNQFPLFSVIMPTYNTDSIFLRKAIGSVINQIYTNWELCIADDCSSNENVRRIILEYSEKNPKIKYIFREKNGHISEASNTALKLASGEFVALLDHDDTLAIDALYQMAKVLQKKPELHLVYSDEDKINEKDERFDPYFKPDWNPDLFLSQNFISHLAIYRRTIVERIGGFRKGYEGSQDWDLAMRFIKEIPENHIFHMPHVLYHWRAISGSTAKSLDQKNYIKESQRKVLQSYFETIGINPIYKLNQVNYWDVHYLIPEPIPKVSIIIPTKNNKELLEHCVNSIISRTKYENYELIIVDNQSDDVSALEYIKTIKENDVVKILKYDSPFNYSAINNFAVNKAEGEVLLFLNNDTEVINDDWLTEMVSLAIRPETGAVGAKMFYPDGAIQHAGVILGVGGVANHAYLNAPGDTVGQMGRAQITQNLSAVTGACLAVERRKFLEVGGFNEIDLKIAFNDIDFCLKLLKAEYKNVWTPHARLYHHESASRGKEDIPEKQARFDSEVKYMLRNWRELLENDPAYNLNLTLDRPDFSLAFPPRVARI